MVFKGPAEMDIGPVVEVVLSEVPLDGVSSDTEAIVFLEEGHSPPKLDQSQNSQIGVVSASNFKEGSGLAN